MGLSCACPITTLPTLSNVICPVDFDQIVKLGFTLAKSSPDFTAEVGMEITNESAWITLLSEAGANKLQVSPAIANLTIPSSEMSAIGGNDNSTVDGMRYYVGEDNVTVAFEIHSATPAVISAMDDLACLSDATLGGSQLTVYMLSRAIRGRSTVIAKAGAATDTYKGIPVFNVRFSTVGSEGYNSKNKYMGSMDFKANDLREIVTKQVEFSPFALVNP